MNDLQKEADRNLVIACTFMLNHTAINLSLAAGYLELIPLWAVSLIIGTSLIGSVTAVISYLNKYDYDS